MYICNCPRIELVVILQSSSNCRRSEKAGEEEGLDADGELHDV